MNSNGVNHLTSRDNEKKTVFRDDQDRSFPGLTLELTFSHSLSHPISIPVIPFLSCTPAILHASALYLM
jgi:hypothetical protein